MPFHPHSYTNGVWRWMDEWMTSSSLALPLIHYSCTLSLSLSLSPLTKRVSGCHSIHFHIEGSEWVDGITLLSLSFSLFCEGSERMPFHSLTHTKGKSGWMGDNHSPCSSSISFTKGVSRWHSIHLHMQRIVKADHFPCTPSISLINSMSECYSIHF